jgi:hypothetical protein
MLNAVMNTLTHNHKMGIHSDIFIKSLKPQRKNKESFVDVVFALNAPLVATCHKERKRKIKKEE